MSEGGQNKGPAQLAEVGFVLQIKDRGGIFLFSSYREKIVPGFLFSGAEPAARPNVGGGGIVISDANLIKGWAGHFPLLPRGLRSRVGRGEEGVCFIFHHLSL